ncbi:hypothetical protein F4819DRAFT_240002 [Hypoxylon fuscum]|nr:hypothetical protein F4819DRAFT_240002 [Hypoxylon fuscum]
MGVKDWRKSTGRASLSHPSWHGRRKAVAIPSVMAVLMVLLVLLADCCYLYGASFRQGNRVHALTVLAVDYDGGAIGQAMSNSYHALQSQSFPTVHFHTASEYPDPSSVERAVCKGDYWGAVYTHQGASSRLSDALGNSAQTTYNPADTITFIYNQVRYPAIADSMLQSNLEVLIAASRSAYYQTAGGREALASLNTSDPFAASAYLNPIQASPWVISPTTQGSRVFYNTVGMVMPVLATFFSIMALNSVGTQTGFLAQARMRDVWLFRFVVGKLYTFLGGLVVTGFTWAFHESWVVDGGKFAKTWMIIWFYMDINWQIFDTLIGTFIPVHFAPFFVLTWVLMNIASTVFPLELAAGWYRVGYALPAHEIYTLLVQVWSGCVNKTYIALPVLFSYWLLGHVLSVFSIRKRCADAERLETITPPAEETPYFGGETEEIEDVNSQTYELRDAGWETDATRTREPSSSDRISIGTARERDEHKAELDVKQTRE